jgi:Glyoxalase/Bleomycin resistance protein/Dioxygenase superfamily
MDITIHPGFLPHTDPDASLASYRDSLGFQVRNDVGYGGLRWNIVGPPDQPGTSIVLEAPFAPGCGVTDEERRIIVEMRAKGTYGWILLATADLDGAFEWLQVGGVPGGPGNPPYPSRARRRRLTATRSRTTWRPAERSSGGRSGALEYVVHRAWAVVERPLGARSQHEGGSQRGGGSQCRRDDDNTPTSPTG